MSGKPIPALGGRTWEELEVLEHDAGQLMFPAMLRRRDRAGRVVETPVRVRAPSPADHFEARKLARAWCKKLELDEKEDASLFQQMEQLCLLSLAIRNFDPPNAQFGKPDDLARYDESCLHDIQEQINAFKAELDPRKSLLTEEELWRAIITIAKEESIDPLVDIAGRDQKPFIVRMALEACRSPSAQSFLQSLGISTPEPSPSPSSAPS